MQKLRFRLAVQTAAVVIFVSLLAGCWEEAKVPAPSSPPPADNSDEIAAAVKAAVESAKSGGSATYVSGPDGKVAVSFAMPGAENVSTSISAVSKAGKSTSSITVTFNTAEPLLLTAKAFAALQTGMDYPQVAQVLGGDMTKGRLGDRYTGDFIVIQAGRRIELSFKDGKVAGKKSKGIN